MNKINKSSVAEFFSDWACSIQVKDIPQSVKKKLNIIVMDSIGLMISAKNEPYIKSLVEALDEKGDCSLIGHNKKVSPFNASIINGTAVHGEDFDDTFEGTPGSCWCRNGSSNVSSCSS